MRSGQFYDKLSDLNDSLYNIKDSYGDWEILDKYSDITGLQIFLFDIGNNETLFAIKGTDVKVGYVSPGDILADVALKNSRVPLQYKHAKVYYQKIVAKHTHVIFTGYSLGGSIAQMLGNEFGNETITFEAFATGSIVSPNHTDNIINFGNILDGVFMHDPNNHLGAIYLMPVNTSATIRNLLTHFPGAHGKPSQAKLCTTKLESNKDYLIRINNETQQEVKHLVKKGYIQVQQDAQKLQQSAIRKTKTALHKVSQIPQQTTKKLHRVVNQKAR